MYSTRSKRKLKKRPRLISKLVGSVLERPSRVGKRGHDTREPKITRGRDNVFEDVGFEAVEAANLRIRADLLLDLREYIRARGWTQAEAAAFFGETQPRISNLLKGEISRFSIDKLINMLARAGIRVRVETAQRAALRKIG
jgi:predicted XRE-type DNA-binding protein